MLSLRLARPFQHTEANLSLHIQFKSHRSHNIYHQYTPFMLAYIPYMDPMGTTHGGGRGLRSKHQRPRSTCTQPLRSATAPAEASGSVTMCSICFDVDLPKNTAVLWVIYIYIWLTALPSLFGQTHLKVRDCLKSTAVEKARHCCAHRTLERIESTFPLSCQIKRSGGGVVGGRHETWDW